MKINYNIVISCFLFLSSTSTFAAWSKSCLDDCFSTNHECHYCAFQCRVEEKDPVVYDTNDPTCPLQNYSVKY